MTTFSTQLKTIEKALFAEIENSGYKYDDKSYSLSICNGYIVLRVECFDENDDVIIVKQEIEMNDNEMITLGTSYNC